MEFLTCDGCEDEHNKNYENLWVCSAHWCINHMKGRGCSARRLGYKSRIVVSPRVSMTKHHHFYLLKRPLGCTGRNNNEKRSHLISVFRLGFR